MYKSAERSKREVQINEAGPGAMSLLCALISHSRDSVNISLQFRCPVLQLSKSSHFVYGTNRWMLLEDYEGDTYPRSP